MIHIVQEDYEENKDQMDYRVKGKHEGIINASSIRNRNLQRMRNFRDHAERKAKKAKEVMQELDERKRAEMQMEEIESEDKV